MSASASHRLTDDASPSSGPEASSPGSQDPREPASAAFLARASEQDGPGLPRFVTREFERALTCGILVCGFARLRCTQCGQDELAAFSSKSHGFCPSCGGRRMSGVPLPLRTERVQMECPAATLRSS
ncbi:MAG: transposase zinc-binding domain-containing protein [Planctomycetota bacterium]|nr:transposase zinc-binding domain-containing protein [Planctomycetota bacterium]